MLSDMRNILFNYLYARSQEKGKLILKIDDHYKSIETV